ncbi:hypothetical protein ACIO93_14790 [Streptomyces sp. NPDC087903]|uniref:hypothetical protein n=1 Tax=Streptomyces sp. NPDC087903 TaxID=3365819 RepID=UPI003827C3C9
MTSAAAAPVEVVEPLVRDAEPVVVDERREIPGGWVAITGGRVTAGSAAAEPGAAPTVSAAGRLVTPGTTVGEARVGAA